MKMVQNKLRQVAPKTRLFTLALLLPLSVAACATPGVKFEQGTSSDNRLTAYQVMAVPPGGLDGKVQNALLVQDNATHTWVLRFASDSYKLSRELVANLLNPAVYAQLIAGRYGISIADRTACHSDVCGGTIISNNGASYSGAVASNQAISAAQSGASAAATQSQGGGL